MDSNNKNHINHNHKTATISLTISKKEQGIRVTQMMLAVLTTMNSKVKVHVVDGSKCVLDCSHDKKGVQADADPSS